MWKIVFFKNHAENETSFFEIALHEVKTSEVTATQRYSNPQPLSSLTNTQPFNQTGQFGCGFESCCSHITFRYRFNLKRVCHMIKTHS